MVNKFDHSTINKTFMSYPNPKHLQNIVNSIDSINQFEKEKKPKPKDKYDFKLFETTSDVDFAKKYNISRERARQLRKQYAPNTKTMGFENRSQKIQKQIDQNILEYIRQNSEIDIMRFSSIYGHTHIQRERFIRIAKENNIDIMFSCARYDVKDHGYQCFRRSCNCEIFKLATTLRAYFFGRDMKVSVSVINYIANTLIDFYKDDNSRYHKEFYDHVIENLTKLKRESKSFRRIDTTDSENEEINTEEDDIDKNKNENEIKKEIGKEIEKEST